MDSSNSLMDSEEEFGSELDPSSTVSELGDSTTVVYSEETMSIVVPIIIVVFFLLVPLAITVFVYCLKRRRQKKDSTDLGVTISTLGTQYEINSLLSVRSEESLGRKLSDKSEEANNNNDVEELEECLTTVEAYGDRVRVSKYIDAGSELSIAGLGEGQDHRGVPHRDGQTILWKHHGGNNRAFHERSITEGEEFKRRSCSGDHEVDQSQDDIDGGFNSTDIDARLGYSMQFLDILAPMAGGESNPVSRPLSLYTTIPELPESPTMNSSDNNNLSELSNNNNKKQLVTIENESVRELTNPPLDVLDNKPELSASRTSYNQPANREEDKKNEPVLNKRMEGFRPYSQILVTQHSTEPYQKGLQGARSEMYLHNQLLSPSSPSPARSDSQLTGRHLPPHLTRGHLPPLPPKLLPLIPPKQAINKSREDIERINKEIIRSSVDLMNKIYDEEDYDIPAPSTEEDQLDSDDTPVSHAQLSLNSGEMEDYDEPSHSFDQPKLTSDSRYYSTPRKEYDEDYEDDIPFETPNQTLNAVHSNQNGGSTDLNGNSTFEDYDEPQIKYRT